MCSTTLHRKRNRKQHKKEGPQAGEHTLCLRAFLRRKGRRMSPTFFMKKMRFKQAFSEYYRWIKPPLKVCKSSCFWKAHCAKVNLQSRLVSFGKEKAQNTAFLSFLSENRGDFLYEETAKSACAGGHFDRGHGSFRKYGAVVRERHTGQVHERPVGQHHRHDVGRLGQGMGRHFVRLREGFHRARRRRDADELRLVQQGRARFPGNAGAPLGGQRTNGKCRDLYRHVRRGGPELNRGCPLFL